MTDRVTAGDLFTGLFASLARRGFTSFSIRTDRVDTAVKAVYDELARKASDLGLNLRFTIQPNAYGESAVVREGLASAGLRTMISIDNPEFQHIRLQPTKLEQIVDLESLPGGSELYRDLAEIFIDNYEAPSATTV